MKNILILFSCIIFCFLSCKKDPPVRVTLVGDLLNPPVDDHRNAVLGYYIGTVHSVHTYFLSDTTYTDTVCIIREINSPDRIRMSYQSHVYNGYLNLHLDYTLSDDNYPYYQNSDVEGAFTFNALTTELYFSVADSWDGDPYFTFTGSK